MFGNVNNYTEINVNDIYKDNSVKQHLKKIINFGK